MSIPNRNVLLDRSAVQVPAIGMPGMVGSRFMGTALVLEFRADGFGRYHGVPWLANVIIGTSVISQLTLPRAIKLAELPIRFIISYEPALGEVDWTRLPQNKVAQIVFGGESGEGSRPAPEAWARQTRDWCKANDTAFGNNAAERAIKAQA